MAIYSETDLVIPALEVISQHTGGITTSDLLTEIRHILRPSGDDLTLLENRSDDKFSQKVRNLKSHNTLERRGLATFANGRFTITPIGKNIANSGKAVMTSLARQGFSEKQKTKALDKGFDEIAIEEGTKTEVIASIRKRSRILRKSAIAYFSDDNGSIACKGCGFVAEDFYGEDASGLIEIHHMKPLFLRNGSDLRISIRDALKFVVPLCPNCHRVVHFDRSRCMPISELQRIVAKMRAGKA